MITRPLNVLSLCDGISVGQLALQKAGIPYRRYIASEIDRHAIKVTHKNFPGTLQIGDLNDVKVSKIPFKIDLVLSGTPCQNFSIAGKLAEFDKDSKGGQLFFRFCQILRDVRRINPDVKFLFENVASMRPHVKQIITTMLGVEPIRIDSTLVSAQTRKRLYWTNIKGVQQPEDRGIILQDILEYDVDPKYYLSEQVLKRINKDAVLKQLAILKLARDKAYAITTTTSRQTESDFLHKRRGILEQVSPSIIQVNPAHEFGGMPRHQNRIYDSDGKSPSLTSSKAAQCNIVAKVNKSQDGKVFAVTGKSQALVAGHGNMPKVALVGRIVGRRLDESGTRSDYNSDIPIEPRVELNADGSKTNCLTTVERDNVVVQLGVVNDNGTLRSTIKSNCIDANYHKGMDNHAQRSMIIHQEDDLIIRRLTEIECERLQTLPDNYTEGISSTQRYKSIGNSWNADTVAHILSYLHN